MAYNTKLTSTFPTELTAGEREMVSAIIKADGAEPEAVWDEAYVTASEDMTLHFVTGSAKLYNDWGANGSTLPTALFAEEGAYLGIDELNGVIPGCYEYSGYVLYTIQTYAVEEEVPVEPEPTPEVPEELPNTGPFEVGLAIVIGVAVLAAVIYWWRTHRAVKHATKRAKGKK